MRFVDFKDRVPNRKINANYKVRHEDGTETKQYWNGTGFINFDTHTWNYFTDIIGWYEEESPTSIEQEVEKLYPIPDNVAGPMLTYFQIETNIQRSAHITAARQYMGEIEWLRAENEKKRIALLMARLALTTCYDVTEHPANGETSQDSAIKIIDEALKTNDHE